MKKFPCEAFGKKSDYSGYDRDSWPSQTHELYKEQVSKFKDAHMAHKDAHMAANHIELERQYGVRYTELLRLPYFDVVEYHVVDPMHNLLLYTMCFIQKWQLHVS